MIPPYPSLITNLSHIVNTGSKFKVAIEAIRGEKTIAALCQEYGVVSSQIAKWKKIVLE
jgi:hypothetical protein